MAKDLPYLPSYRNVGRLFEAIAAAKQPDSFTHQFLGETLGIKGSADRPLIPLLRALGFVDASNRPTASYGELKNPARRRAAIANGIRGAYAPLFAANENADKLGADELKGLVAQVAGTDDNMTQKIVYTFNSLKPHADFSAAAATNGAGPGKQEPEIEAEELEVVTPRREDRPRGGGRFAEPQFHYNINVQLPANGTEETYLNIFAAVRKVFPS